jgi:hypothetical protein
VAIGAGLSDRIIVGDDVHGATAAIDVAAVCSAAPDDGEDSLDEEAEFVPARDANRGQIESLFAAQLKFSRP